MEKAKICRNCKYWHPNYSYSALAEIIGLSGDCKRYPPKPTEYLAEWPCVKENDFCGEFEERDYVFWM